MPQALIDKIVLHDDKIEIYYNYKPTRPDEQEHDFGGVTSKGYCPPVDVFYQTISDTEHRLGIFVFNKRVE